MTNFQEETIKLNDNLLLLFYFQRLIAKCGNGAPLSGRKKKITSARNKREREKRETVYHIIKRYRKWRASQRLHHRHRQDSRIYTSIIIIIKRRRRRRRQRRRRGPVPSHQHNLCQKCRRRRQETGSSCVFISYVVSSSRSNSLL